MTLYHIWHNVALGMQTLENAATEDFRQSPGVVLYRCRTSGDIPCIERFASNDPLINGFTCLGFTCLGTADRGRPFGNEYLLSSKLTLFGGKGSDVPGAGEGERRSVTCAILSFSQWAISLSTLLCNSVSLDAGKVSSAMRAA